MSQHSDTKHELVEQDKALEVYLQNLLGAAEPKIAPETQQTVAKLIEQMPIVEEEVTEPSSTGKAAMPTIPDEPAVAAKMPVVELDNPALQENVTKAIREVVKPADADIPLPPEGGIPSWAQDSTGFQCLFFDVAGLVLAVPLIHLGGIHRIQNVNNIVGKPSWFKGMMRTENDDAVHLVDTAKWIMPDQYSTLESKLNYEYAILLDNSPWGLACSRVSEAVTLHQADIKWRLKAGKRPWLAGMVKDRMCVLLDVHRIISLLEHAQA